MKICADCKHSFNSAGEMYRGLMCKKEPSVDIIYGGNNYDTAASMRILGCGREAKYFEPSLFYRFKQFIRELLT